MARYSGPFDLKTILFRWLVGGEQNTHKMKPDLPKKQLNLFVFSARVGALPIPTVVVFYTYDYRITPYEKAVKLAAKTAEIKDEEKLTLASVSVLPADYFRGGLIYDLTEPIQKKGPEEISTDPV